MGKTLFEEQGGRLHHQRLLQRPPECRERGLALGGGARGRVGGGELFHLAPAPLGLGRRGLQAGDRLLLAIAHRVEGGVQRVRGDRVRLGAQIAERLAAARAQ